MTPVEHMAALKAGDSFDFAEYEIWGPKVLKRLTVERKTATMIVCRVGYVGSSESQEVRFRLATGNIVGDGYGSFPTPVGKDERLVLVREAKTRASVSRLEREKWGALPLEVLGQVERIIEKAKGE